MKAQHQFYLRICVDIIENYRPVGTLRVSSLEGIRARTLDDVDECARVKYDHGEVGEDWCSGGAAVDTAE